MLTRRIELGLIILAIGMFCLSALMYGVSQAIPSFSGSFVPSSIISAAVLPLTIVLLIEIMHLVLSFPGTLVEFLQKQYEVATLIVLREVFKQLSKIADGANPGQPLPGDVLQLILLGLFGSLLLYVLVEILQRVSRRFLRADLRQEPPGLRQIKLKLTWLLGTGFILITAYYLWRDLSHWQYQLLGAQYLVDLFSIFIFFDVALLLLSMVFYRSYVLLFEYTALILASIMIRLAISADLLTKIELLAASLVFSICTILVHAFVRADEPTNAASN